MPNHHVKMIVLTIAAALALAACAQSGSSSMAAYSEPESDPTEVSSAAPSAAPTSTVPPAPTPVIEVAPDAGDPFDADEPFAPFPQGPPALPAEALAPAAQADMDALLAGKNHASWMYRMEDTNLAYQYRFFPDGYFSASLGRFETDSGVYTHGTGRFLRDGLLEAMVWLPDENDNPAYPVYLTVQLEWPGEDRDVIVATLLTLEDTSPTCLMEKFFRPAVGVPLPMDLYAD